MTTRAKPRTDEPTGDTLHDRFRPLTAADVREMTDAGSFDRGRSYARTQQIFDASLRGQTLHASSHGSSGGPYRVEASLVPTADPNPRRLVAGYGCTCPRGGFCKHLVALLLTWIEQPEVFAVRPTVAELLADKSREDLLAIVELMVRREPDLADLIELAPPAPALPDAPFVPAEPGSAAARTVSPAAIHRQVNKAFSAIGDAEYGGWYGNVDLSGVAQELESLVAIGDGYAAVGRWADASVIYGTILEEATEQWESLGDEEAVLLHVFGRAAIGIAACFKVQSDLPTEERIGAEERAEIIERLIEFGDMTGEYDLGEADGEPFDPFTVIAAHATEAERAVIEDQLRAIIDKPTAENDWSAPYDKRGAIWSLSLLRGGMTDEEALAEFQKAELWDDAASVLLKLDRIDEAVALAGRKLTQLGALTGFADQLAARSGADADRAIDLIEGRLWEKEGAEPHADAVLLTWLGAKYAALGRPDRALAAEHRRFKLRPALDTYQAVRTAAALPGQPADAWTKLHPELLKTLGAKNDLGTLIQIHLDEGQTAEAIAALRRLDAGRRTPGGAFGGGWGVGGGLESLRERVAAAAEESDPDEAIRLYTLVAEGRIEWRQRQYYQTAAAALARAKAVYAAQNRLPEWRAYIRDLREKHKRLRALREELDALDLI